MFYEEFLSVGLYYARPFNIGQNPCVINLITMIQDSL